MTSKYLPARISEEAALQRFRRPRFLNLFGLLRARPVREDSNGRPTSLELVWMPLYAYRFSLTHKGKPVESWVSVDASFGGFALLSRIKEVVEGEPEGAVFPPVLDVEHAEELAREGVVRYILRKRGAKPAVNAITETQCFHTPVWVYYFRSFGNKIDLAILDGYTGDAMGGLMRRAIVEGFIARSPQ